MLMDSASGYSAGSNPASAHAPCQAAKRSSTDAELASINIARTICSSASKSVTLRYLLRIKPFLEKWLSSRLRTNWNKAHSYISIRPLACITCSILRVNNWYCASLKPRKPDTARLTTGRKSYCHQPIQAALLMPLCSSGQVFSSASTAACCCLSSGLHSKHRITADAVNGSCSLSSIICLGSIALSFNADATPPPAAAAPANTAVITAAFCLASFCCVFNSSCNLSFFTDKNCPSQRGSTRRIRASIGGWVANKENKRLVDAPKNKWLISLLCGSSISEPS